MDNIESETLTPSAALATYGKSFNWAKKFLGKTMGTDAAILYRFCRVLDDMADGDIIDGPERLFKIRDSLLKNYQTDDPLLIEFELFITSKKLPKLVIISLIDGLLGDQEIVLIKNEFELLRYCYRVAGTVGILMCNVLDCDETDATDYAIDLGIAMQLTNIARDILEDAQMGRRYLPESWVGDVTPEEIVQISQHPKSKRAQDICIGSKKLLNLAEQYYTSGLTGCAYLPLRAHAAISIAALVYRQIGIKTKNKRYPWFNGREFTSISEKIICSFFGLLILYKRLFKKVQHKSILHDGLRGLPYVK
ncbi:phytoene/squalene synthase family protein [Amylibacter sp.]|nr:phytoene/squalene synthase family protein [Amylibacter sp.]